MAGLGVEMVLIVADLVILGSIWWFYAGLKAHLDDSLEILDRTLAGAIMEVAQSAASSNIEQPNPLQMMIMQLIQQRMQQERGSDGRFRQLPVENRNR